MVINAFRGGDTHTNFPFQETRCACTWLKEGKKTSSHRNFVSVYALEVILHIEKVSKTKLHTNMQCIVYVL